MQKTPTYPTTNGSLEIFKPIKKLLNDIEFTKYAELIKNTSGDQILDIDDLGYQDEEIIYMFTELYYRPKPIKSIQ
jgi:hypothetical protein